MLTGLNKRYADLCWQAITNGIQTYDDRLSQTECIPVLTSYNKRNADLC